jgi:putative transposase
MSKLPSADPAGATYFFTLALQDRSTRWLVEHVGRLRQAVAHAKARHPFRIAAMVVLPEHLHALWRLPPGDDDAASRWLLVKQGFAEGLAAAGGPRAAGEAGHKLWRRRFWEHRIADAQDFQRHVDYIHFNPVKHGWVQRAVDWPHSSLHRFIREGTLAPDWGISAPIEGEYGE